MASLRSLWFPPSKHSFHCLLAVSPPKQPRFTNLLAPSSSFSTLSLPSLSSTTTTTTTFAAVTTAITSQGDGSPLTTLCQSESMHGNHLKIAIIGFGNLGRFLAKTFVSQGHTVLAYSRSNHSIDANSLGVSFFLDPHGLCEQHPDVILLCTSIISTEEVLKSLPLQKLKRNTLFVDVLSVKEFSKNLLLDHLPSNFDIICSHPMFGPQSAKLGWKGVNFVYESVRIGNEESRVNRCNKLLHIFAREGCRMVEMNCQEHDKYAAESQFITHTLGRMLQMLNLESTPINTKGYESLLDLVENVTSDSFDLYYGLFVYNKNALDMLKRLNSAFQALKQQLLGRLQKVLTNQLLRNVEKEQSSYWSQKSGHCDIAAFGSDSVTVKFRDAVQPYEYKGRNSDFNDESSKLKIGIVGFGNFGQFLAKTMVQQGHKVLTYSRKDYSHVARELGVSYFSNAVEICDENPDVILFCTSILSTESVLKLFPVQRLRKSTLFVDVLSVKEFPRNLFLQHLSPDSDILCTHPMFGPESGKNGWNHLPFVFDKVRIGTDEERMLRCHRFLDIFAQEGCRMVAMSCAEHDRHAAGSQFITHTIGRVLEKLGLESTPINIKGYETLLNLVENTAGDSFDLYYGLFMYNVNAMEQLERLDLAFDSLKKQLLGKLHDVLSRELFGNCQALNEYPMSKVSQNDSAMKSSLEHLTASNN
ncbi:hypothetical protein K2173_017772 [Erythroxylum novogranatense]|uniref:Prephenate/arogenate dehydrogenase domain-containing protein n=1 Tax=Erythroxylum novogranatense TaxID=1862640 RepID=A0AAV8SLM9_9ROSI|nr:hypothetical protein K2173_017772 [Erythroxylum novogranatense]